MADAPFQEHLLQTLNLPQSEGTEDEKGEGSRTQALSLRRKVELDMGSRQLLPGGQLTVAGEPQTGRSLKSQL